MSARVEKILMERDEVSKAEAKGMIADFKRELWLLAGEDSSFAIFGADDLLMEQLGLEPDYLEDLI